MRKCIQCIDQLICSAFDWFGLIIMMVIGIVTGGLMLWAMFMLTVELLGTGFFYPAIILFVIFYFLYKNSDD